MAFLSIAGSFGALLVGWLVVVARAVYRKTPIYFLFYTVQATAKICNSYFEPLFGYFTVLNHCAPPPFGTFRNKNVTFCHFPIFYKSKIFLFRMDDLKNTAFLRFNSRAAPLTPFCKHYEGRKLFLLEPVHSYMCPVECHCVMREEGVHFFNWNT